MTSHDATYHDGSLTLALRDTDDGVYVLWTGKSTARDPGPFILDVLMRATEIGAASGKPLVLDFQDIGYMNSSTITPLIRVLEKAKRGQAAVRVLYRKALRWQALNFTALEVFETADKRIEIRGV